jgi:8-oxo-dGTP diphosphatase
VVDVANVMGSRPDGWWRDRAGAAVRLYSELAALAASGRVTLPGDTSPDGAAEEAAPGDALREDAAQEETAQEETAQEETAQEETAQEETAAPPDFVMVLEGAARAAASRIRAAEAADPDRPAQPGQVRVVEARGSGDDAIVALVRELDGRRAVVTADRELRDRCAAAGAAVLGPAWLLGLLRQ